MDVIREDMQIVGVKGKDADDRERWRRRRIRKGNS